MTNAIQPNSAQIREEWRRDKKKKRRKDQTSQPPPCPVMQAMEHCGITSIKLTFAACHLLQYCFLFPAKNSMQTNSVQTMVIGHVVRNKRTHCIRFFYGALLLRDSSTI